MKKYSFFAKYNNVWQKFTGIYCEGYLHTSNLSFPFKKTKGRKMIHEAKTTAIWE